MTVTSAKDVPALIVTPHNSGEAPLDVLGQMLGDAVFDDAARAERLAWLTREGDPLTDLIFHVPGARALHATVSRFVVDLNRARGAGGDNGVLKLTDFEGRPLYPPGFELPGNAAEERLRRFWDPFHAEIEHVLAHENVRLLVVGHSMQARGPKIGPDAGAPRPALTLMTGGDERGEGVNGRPTSLPPPLARELLTLLGRHFGELLGRADLPPPALNRPWSNDGLSLRHGSARVPAFGLEINRALYLGPPEGSAAIPGRPQKLNAAFRAFLDAALLAAHP